MTQNTSFESSLKELEQIIAGLEKGELSLEEQLKVFERGVALSRACLKQLDEVEQKIEVLIENTDSTLSTQKFEP